MNHNVQIIKFNCQDGIIHQSLDLIYKYSTTIQNMINDTNDTNNEIDLPFEKNNVIKFFNFEKFMKYIISCVFFFI